MSQTLLACWHLPPAPHNPLHRVVQPRCKELELLAREAEPPPKILIVHAAEQAHGHALSAWGGAPQFLIFYESVTFQLLTEWKQVSL